MEFLNLRKIIFHCKKKSVGKNRMCEIKRSEENFFYACVLQASFSRCIREEIIREWVSRGVKGRKNVKRGGGEASVDDEAYTARGVKSYLIDITMRAL